MSTEANRADIAAIAKGGRTNLLGFPLRLMARIPFLFIAGRLYGEDALGRFASALVIDPVDEHLAADVAATGMTPVVVPSIMSTPEVAANLARATLAASDGDSGRR